MGNGTMRRNLEESNVYRDSGIVPLEKIFSIEKLYGIKLPKVYVQFIAMHNGARLNADSFTYDDPNVGRKNSDAIAFLEVEGIIPCINDIKSGEEPNWDIKYKFEDGLVPFGDNGGGDMICFDYRKDKTTDNPPVVIWNHDMGFDHRVVFIANSFEEFIGMLHAYEEEE